MERVDSEGEGGGWRWVDSGGEGGDVSGQWRFEWREWRGWR